MLVKQIMSQPVVVCQAEDTLHQAAKLMWERDCGAIPITDQDGKALAMLTDRDICMAAYTQGQPLTALRVRTAMSAEFYTCSPEDTLTHAANLMRQHQIRRLPVLAEDGRPVGVISLNDIVLAATKQHPAAPRSASAISLTRAAQTMAAVCGHRTEQPSPQPVRSAR